MNIRDLDLNLLRVFQAAAEERSVTKAADRLGLSQPAVSNALKRLRLSLKDRLLVRGAGGMSLTPRGEELAAALSGVMQGIEAAIAGNSEIDASRIAEPILITCADEEILLHGGDILSALEDAGCRAPVQYLPLNTDYRSDLLWRNRLAVTITTMMYAPDGLKQRKLYDDFLVCLLRADHPAALRLDLDAYMSAGHLLIAPLGGAPTGYLDTWFRAHGKDRQIRLISHSFGSAARLVRETGLIATIPSRQAAMLGSDSALISAPVPADVPPFGLHMFWSERYDQDPVNIWLRTLLTGAILGRRGGGKPD